MHVTFLGHSGFLAELPSVTLLFDWTEGELPALRPGVPLCVFASHSHEDHLSPRILTLPADCFLLGRDIKPRRLERLGAAPETLAKCRFLRGGEEAEPVPGVTVETLSSTDEGVAYLVTADGRTVFHAGDLNWWHWEGEEKAWNRNMEVNFKRYTEPLRGRRIDLAMLPLDPRLGEDGFRGPRYFLELADIARFLPMHQWGQYGFTRDFLDRYPAFADRAVSVSAPGETFHFS